jgi:Transglutaminase-like superfamily
MNRLNKLWSVSRREKQLFCEAFFLLLLSQLSIKVIPFRHIYSFLCAHWNGIPAGSSDQAQDIRLVTLSLSRAANQLPWRSLCLSRSIAAFIMLRRRRIAAVMFAGVKPDDSSLHAHAWVQAGTTVIDANAEKSTFIPLMSIGPESADD